MKLWIVRFVPKAGSCPIDAAFHSEERARTQFDAIYIELGPIRICDDFGIEQIIDPTAYSVILTNTDSGAAVQRALHDANRDAAQTYGLMMKTPAPGSTVQ